MAQPAFPIDSFDIITILGPTASGKTRLAARLAALWDAEIISADSRQVYRQMDLGTGKDLEDYVVDGVRVPCHLVDIAEPGTKYNLYQYQQDFLNAYTDIKARGRRVICCGGSGLYVESILRGYHLSPVEQNPELRARLAGKTLAELTEILRAYRPLHNTTDTDTCARAIRAIEIEAWNAEHPTPERPFPELKSLTLGVEVDRETRRSRISRRLHAARGRYARRGARTAGPGHRGRGPYLLWPGVQIPDPLRHGPVVLRGNVPPVGDCHPSVCQAPDDVVSRYGAARCADSLGAARYCRPTDRRLGGVSDSPIVYCKK